MTPPNIGWQSFDCFTSSRHLHVQLVFWHWGCQWLVHLEHPYSRNFNSAGLVYVAKVKSFVNGLFSHPWVCHLQLISKCNLVPKWVMSGSLACSEVWAWGSFLNSSLHQRRWSCYLISFGDCWWLASCCMTQDENNIIYR